MGQAVKGGMYCNQCGPVAAQKTTHRMRNTLTTLGTAGVGATIGQWHCPHCGGPVIRAPKAAGQPGELSEDAVLGIVIGGIAVVVVVVMALNGSL